MTAPRPARTGRRPTVAAGSRPGLPPLSLYVHVPWCVRKCPYCDFNSHPLRAELPESAYVDALLADLEHELERAAGRELESVFIGGGTPSLLGVAAVGRLIGGIRERAALCADAEITLEANPGAADVGRFVGYAQAGVTRLSIGVQSFDDRLLARIGRVHDAAAARRAARAATASGVERVNIDLMFALPEQCLDGALRDVEEAIALDPDHISYYQLTLEPNTEFHRRPPPLPAEDLSFEIQQRGVARLAEAGYQCYEVSAHARRGARCSHNLNYWRFGDYLGIGAGAHGKITFPGHRAVQRSVKHRHPRRYLDAVAAGGADRCRYAVPRSELPFEFMLNALRLVDGFEPDLFEARTGLVLEHVGATLERAVADGLLLRDGARIAPTELGRRFLDDLVARFLCDGDDSRQADRLLY